MKKILIVLAAGILSVPAFATDDGPVPVTRSAQNINKTAVASFARDFKNANGVNWEKSDEFYFAYFLLNNEPLVAAYDDDGNKISVSRYIEFNELPLSVNMEIEKKYPAYKKSGRVTEVAYENDTVYYFTLVSDKQAVRIKTTPNGFLNVTGKQKIHK